MLLTPGVLVVFAGLLGLADPSVTYSQLGLHTRPGHVDMWTMAESGCTCPGQPAHTCPCCAPGGCPCPEAGASRCVQCGLEDACANVCNVTVSSARVGSQSGLNFGEIKSSPGIRGPVSCYFRFLPNSGERVELHVYRLLRIGHLDPNNNRCSGGGLEFLSPVTGRYPMLCGENGRYSPPVVMFGEEAQPGQVLITVRDITPRTQWLLHYSFTPVTDPSLGLKMTGAIKSEESDCEYVYTECSESSPCSMSSPGYPGIYPQHTRCRYLLHHTRVSLRIRTDLPTDRQSCKTNFVKIHNISQWENGGGNKPSRKAFKKLCGGVEEEIVLNAGSLVIVEFSSGLLKPPFLFSGFEAEIKFLWDSESKALESLAKPAEFQDDSLNNIQHTSREYGSPSKVEPRHLLVQQDEAILKYNADNVIETITRPTKILGKHRKLPDFPDIKTFKCHQEVTEPDRSGFIQSTRLTYTNGTCSLVFRGEQRDLVLLSLDTLVLSGPNCSSHLSLSIQDPSQPRGLRTVKKFCSPLVLRSHDEQPHSPLIVESSLVFLDFFTINQTHDMFSGAFAFQNTLLEGKPQKNSYCSNKISGDAITWLPKLQGTLSTPPRSPLLWPHLGPLKCSTQLQSGGQQSVLLTLRESYLANIGSERGCDTVCNGLGCVCSNPIGADTITIVINNSNNNGVIMGDSKHCLCGDFQKYLPLSFAGRESLSLVYTSSNYNFQEANNLLKTSSKYEFLKTVKIDCGQLLFNSTSGSISRPSNKTLLPRLPTDQRYHEECEWVVSPPPSSSLSLLIDTSDISNVSCSGWQLRVWTVDKQSGRSESVDSMCGEDNRREYTVPSVYSRILHIAVSSIHKEALAYKVSWITSGPLKPDSLHFQTSDRGHAGGQASDQGVQVVGVGGMGGLDLDSGAGKLNMRMVTVLLLVPVLFGLL